MIRSNRLSSLFELRLKRADTSGGAGGGSPGSRRRQRHVIDTSSSYVRGEENLSGWRPHGDGLIVEHQWKLDHIEKLCQVGGSSSLFWKHGIFLEASKDRNISVQN